MAFRVPEVDLLLNPHGCVYTWRVLFVSVLEMTRALLFGVYITATDFWKIPPFHACYSSIAATVIGLSNAAARFGVGWCLEVQSWEAIHRAVSRVGICT